MPLQKPRKSFRVQPYIAMSISTPTDKFLAAGDTIGILGSGQLGQMLAQAATALGLKTHIYSPDDNAYTTAAATLSTQGAYDDVELLTQFAKSVKVVTYEFENVPQDTVAFLAQHIPVRPNIRALEIAQDRLTEKNFIRAQGIDVTSFADITSLSSLTQALENFGGDGILKTRRFGYDGKGQWRLNSRTSAKAAFANLKNQPAILEALVPFDCEISVLAARALDGSVQVFDCVENVHENHILKHSYAPADINDSLHNAAKQIAVKLLGALDYVGVLGVEMFVCGTRLMVNEIAPRVHNSGHWTQDACDTSQFEQHIRAVAGWSLGNPARHHDAVMTNLLGSDIDSIAKIAGEKNAHIHNYGKTEARTGRKMGHVNRLYPIGGLPKR